VVPLGAGILYSLLYSIGVAGVVASGFTMRYWLSAFSKTELPLALVFSAYIAFASTGIAVALALYTTLRLKRRVTRGWFSYVLYLPLTMPAIAAAFFVFQLLAKSGFVSRLTASIGLTNGIADFPDLINDTWGIGIIFTHVLLAFPFFSIVFANLFQSERVEEFQQLAMTLGASPLRTAKNVSIPILLRKGIAPIALYCIFVFGSYEIPLLLGRQSVQMVSLLTVRKLQRYDLMDRPEGYIVALSYTAIVLTVLLLVMKRRKNSYEI
jgi:putative spermidine/putrescine transport system permease protein